MRLIDADALVNSYDVRKVTEYDESGCGIDYKAVPVKAIEAAPTIDAVSPGVLEQVRWERDTAIAQLEELGIGFGQKKPDMVEVVRCEDCIYWKPRHIKLNDGSERAYLPGEVYVDITVGINVTSQCMVDEYEGYGCDKSVFRRKNDFCSRGMRKMDAEVQDGTK